MLLVTLGHKQTGKEVGGETRFYENFQVNV